MSDDEKGQDQRMSERLADRIKRSLEPTAAGGTARSQRKELLDRARQSEAGIPIPAESDDPFAVQNRPGRGTTDDITRNLTNALRLNEASNNHGQAALSSLNKQREVLQRSSSAVQDTNDTLMLGKRVIREMRMAIWQERGIKGLIIVFLIIVIFAIVYSKWVRRK